MTSMPVFCSSLAFLLLFAGAASARSLNGFPLEGASIPANEIRRGGLESRELGPGVER